MSPNHTMVVVPRERCGRPQRTTRRRGTRTGIALALGALLLAAAACDTSQRETRTWRLARLSPPQAADLIGSYLSDGSAVTVTDQPPTLTVRGTERELASVEELLAEHDASPQNLALRFQVIEANGFEGSDPAIADVESALRELFRYRGYRLADEMFVRSSAQGHFSQRSEGYVVQGGVRDITRQGDGYRVHLEVALQARRSGPVLETSVSVPVGQTVVLGSGRTPGGEGAVILVVRPTVEELPVLGEGGPGS